MRFWQRFGWYELEVVSTAAGDCQYSGWYRCIGGRLADGRWPVWKDGTGEVRYDCE